MRKGRFSKEEQQFIEQNCEAMPLEELAKELDRDVSSIEKHIKTKLGKGISKEEEGLLQASYDLKSRPYWQELTKQFDEEELEMFLFHWAKMIAQFKDDVFHTEEMQVVDAIKLEILMNRSLREKRNSAKDIEAFEALITEEKQKDEHDRDNDYIFQLERQIASLRAAQESLSRDYKDLQAKKSIMLKDLKGTREQRIKFLEDSKETFSGWMRKLLTNEDFRQGLGQRMEKMRLAMHKEKERLSEYHIYEDGLGDQPFLTPDTVKEDN